MGLRPKPPASTCGDPFAPRRSRHYSDGAAPRTPRRPLAGTPSPRAAPAEARRARLAESAPFYGADSSFGSVPHVSFPNSPSTGSCGRSTTARHRRRPSTRRRFGETAHGNIAFYLRVDETRQSERPTRVSWRRALRRLRAGAPAPGERVAGPVATHVCTFRLQGPACFPRCRGCCIQQATRRQTKRADVQRAWRRKCIRSRYASVHEKGWRPGAIPCDPPLRATTRNRAGTRIWPAGPA